MTNASQPIVERVVAHVAPDRDSAASAGGATRQPRRRYSRFVQLSKLVSAAVALTLIILVVVWPQFGSRDNSFQMGISKMESNDAESLHMVNPRYTGRDENNLPYEVTADLASQETAKSDLITLDNPKADLLMKDGTWVAATATSGLYGQTSQELELTGEVNLFHDSGYEFSSTRAILDLNNGAGHGDQPTFGHGPAGEIEGEGFNFTDKGKTITFTGKSRLILYPNAESPSSAGPRP
jgi:lipopolysaccharide export system protein LptC